MILHDIVLRGVQCLWVLAFIGGVSIIPSQARAAVVTYEWSGNLSSVMELPYGKQLKVGDPIAGQFSYNTASKATHVFATSTGFEQNLPAGLYGKSSGVLISADHYLVVMANNIVQPIIGSVDNLSISYSSAFGPALGGPLYVDGVPQSVGQFRLIFTAPGSLFSVVGPANLPLDMTISNFLSATGIFSDAATGVIDVQFSITNLRMIPEPGSYLLLIAGAPMVLYAIARARRRA
jgi:hypothetical protein